MLRRVNRGSMTDSTQREEAPAPPPSGGRSGGGRRGRNCLHYRDHSSSSPRLPIARRSPCYGNAPRSSRSFMLWRVSLPHMRD